MVKNEYNPSYNKIINIEVINSDESEEVYIFRTTSQKYEYQIIILSQKHIPQINDESRSVFGEYYYGL